MLDAGSGGDHLTGELEPGDVGRRVGRRGVEAAALDHVGAVEPGGAYRDEQLARSGLWIGMLLPVQVAVDHRDCTHRRSWVAGPEGSGPGGLGRVTLPSPAVEGSPDLVVLDEDGEGVELDAAEASALFAMTDDLEAATVSACPTCRSRVLACLALVDLLDGAAPHPRASELIELADDAPTLHLYVHDVATTCRHRDWLDPGRGEWADFVRRVRRPRR